MSIVWPERPSRSILPPPAASDAELGIERIETMVVRPIGVADDQEANLVLCVVDNRVGDARAGRKCHYVAWSQSKKIAVNPDIRIAGEHEDQLFVLTMGVRRRGSSSGR